MTQTKRDEFKALAEHALMVASKRATKGKYVRAGVNGVVHNYVFTEGPRPGVLESHVCDLQDESVEGMAVLQRGWGEAQHTPDPEDFMERNMAYLLAALNDYPKLARACLSLLAENRMLQRRLAFTSVPKMGSEWARDLKAHIELEGMSRADAARIFGVSEDFVAKALGEQA